MKEDFKTGGRNFKLRKGDILIKNKQGEMVFYFNEEEDYILVGIWNERRDPGMAEINLAELLAVLRPNFRKAVFDVKEFMENLTEQKPTEERHELLLTDMLTGKKAVLGLKLSRPV
jgi:hypothetical protein